MPLSIFNRGSDKVIIEGPPMSGVAQRQRGIWLHNEEVSEGCTIGIANGGVTIDERPMLWKVRDLNSHYTGTRQQLFFSSGTKYDYIGVRSEGGGLFMGLNEAGVATGNSLVKPIPGLASNSSFQWHILGNHDHLDQISDYIQSEIDDSTCNASGCFPFIDAQGNAALFEINRSEWFREYDSIDPDRQDQGLFGFVVRANEFHDQDDGTDSTEIKGRYESGKYNVSGLVNIDELSVKTIIQGNDYANDYEFARYGPGRIYRPISRYDTTKSAIAVHGVAPGENPELATMWVILGQTNYGIAVPAWVKVDSIPDCLSSGLMYDRAFSLFIKGDEVTTQASVFHLESHMFDMVMNRMLLHWRSSGAPSKKELTRIEHRMADDAYSLMDCLDNRQLDNKAPELSFDFTRRGLTVDFVLTGDDDGETEICEWDFGDDTTSTQESPSHTYANPNTYLVSCTVTDDDSVANTDWRYIEVQDSYFSYNPWPMCYHDPQHTGWSSYSGPESNDVRWTYFADEMATNGTSGISVGPDGTVYFGTTEGLYALTQNGKFKWKYETDKIRNSPLVDASGNIYFVTLRNSIEGNRIVSIHSDGQLNWELGITTRYSQYGNGDAIVSLVIDETDRLYYAAPCVFNLKQHPSLFCIDPDNGLVNWIYDLVDKQKYVSPFDGVSYVPGAPFDESVPGPTSSPAIGPDGTVYIGIAQTLFALHQDGTIKWEKEFDVLSQHRNVGNVIIARDGTIYVVIKATYEWTGIGSSGFGNTLFAYHPDGNEKWKLNGIWDEMPLIDFDNILYITKKGWAFDHWVGDIKGIDPDGNQFLEIPGMYYPRVGDIDGNIYCIRRNEVASFNTANGSQNWNWTANTVYASPSPLALGNDMTLLVPTFAGLYGLGDQLGYNYDFPQQGWYLASLPVVPEDNSTNSLFPDALDACTWEGDQYNQATEIDNGFGYWLAIPSSYSCYVEGVLFHSYKRHYTTGWHIVGGLAETVNFSDPNDNPDGSVLAAFGWDPFNECYFPTTTFEPKDGYWIAVGQECDLTVGNHVTMAAKTTRQVDKESFFNQFGSLPPAPPQMYLDVKSPVQTPENFFLEQNVPNPFNVETTIRYQIPEESPVRITIYNMLGHEVRRLVDEAKVAGYYEIKWDGCGNRGEVVGSGIYIIYMRAGSYSQAKKVLVVQ